MATLDEELDAIHKKFLSWSRFDETTPGSRAELNQAIKELFCKHLGCKTSYLSQAPFAVVYTPPQSSCICCGREFVG